MSMDTITTRTGSERQSSHDSEQVRCARSRRSRVVGAGLLAVGLLGCEASLGNSGTGDGSGRGASSGLPDGNNTALDRSTDCSEDSISRSPVRRLNMVELNNTLEDLFPGAGAGAREISEEPPIHGFENNVQALNPSALLVEDWNKAVRYAANRVATNRGKSKVPTLGCEPSESDCPLTFVKTFGRRAFRRPLTDEEVEQFHAYFLDKQAKIDFDGALELTLQAFLQSPEFVYRLEFGIGEGNGKIVPLTDWEMANRLSYALWQTMPDEELFALAEEGKLSEPPVYEEQVERLLDDERAAQAFGDYHRQWLELDGLLNQRKDGSQFPDWSSQLRDDIHEESIRFAELLFASGDATQTSLLTSRRAEVNLRLAAFYGATGPADNDTWMEVELDQGQRAGIFTRGAYLADAARPTNGSPPIRGVHLLEKLLCAAPPEPPPNVDITLPEQDPDKPLSNRELFESKTSQAGCLGCHAQIDGIGMAFEHYDATGAYRNEDAGQPVDASGELIGTDVDQSYDDAVEMSEVLSGSQQVAACLMVNWYRFIQGRDEEPEDWCKVDALENAFVEGGGDFRAMIEAAVTSTEFKHRKVID